ncbi:Suppressor of Sensor Kinase (SLN1) [Coemansia sp. BCRC 34962]|nr:Suppressor of Sensor Kinase (SLN1) [Coemansia sp. BCRC 34962]
MDASSETDSDSVLPVSLAAPAAESLSTIPGRLRNSVSLDEMLGSSSGGNDSDSSAAAATTADGGGSGSRREGIGTRGVARHHSIHRTLLSEAAAPPLPTLIIGDGIRSQELADSPDASQFGALAGGSHSSNSDVDSGVNKLDLSPKLNDRECHERAEWQHMLTVALTGQVVDSEKKRLNTLADSSLFNLTDNEYAEHLSDLLQSRDFSQQFRNIHVELWLGCRAAIRGRTPLQEKQTLESLRALYTDSTLRAVMDFSADRVVTAAAASAAATTDSDGDALTAEFSAQCLIQLQRLLRWVDYVEGLYPTLRALSEAKPIYASQPFQDKLAAIISWTNISVRLGLLHTMIQQWTGSRELSLYSTASLELYASTTAGITKGGIGGGSISEQGTASEATHCVRSLSSKGYQHTPFVERLLKENGMKMIFEQKILTELEEVVLSARCDLIENSVLLAEMGLPVINRHMQELLRFPPRLLQTCLLIRLQSAENLNNPTMVQVDQLLDDIRDSLSVACRVKRTFNSLAGPANSWNPGVQLDPEYDRTLRSCLQMFFRLLHRKLNISNDVVGGTKVFEVLENQWPFLLEVVRDIEGGQYELALRYCQQSRFLVQTWTRILARLLQGPPAYDSMNSREFSKWFSSVSQAIRSPILRGQRLMRTIQNAVANSTDYEFNDPFPLLALLVDSKHVLVYTSGEWESRGVYIIGSQALQQKPHLARELLDSCINDDVLAKDQYRDCYLLAIRTDAEFNWTGASVVSQGRPIQYQDLELCPGQMRLISPGIDRLEGHRKWLERINIATELQGWETATAVTDAIIEDWIKSRSARHSNNNPEGVQGKRARPSSTSSVGDLRRIPPSVTGVDGGERAHSDANVVCREPRATSNHSGDDNDMDEFDETKSDYAALRPSLEPYDKRLAQINTPSHSLGIARDDGPGGIGGKAKPHAAARVRELIRAHNPSVQREWSLLKYSIMRLMDALTQVPDMLRMLHLVFHERRALESGGYGAALPSPQAGDSSGNQSAVDPTCRGDNCDLLEQVQESFSFVSNTAARMTRLLDLKAERYVRLALLHMCVGWCGFITEDCMANEKRTFSWAVQALEYTMRASKHNTVKVLPPEEWQMLKSQVAGCLTLMIGHFDILGARNEESLNNELQKERDQALRHMDDPNALLSLDGIGANYRTQQMQKQRVQHSQQVDQYRDRYLHDSSRIGRVLEVTARPEDQTLRLLAASPSNINIRWQIGRNIGGGAFGSVYIGYNLDTGEMMAVKEIRFPSRPLERAPAGLGHGMRAGGEVGRDHPGHKIAREMKVMSMLQHPNIVTYYGFEVHREKVYLFMELCSKGSLAQVIRDQGRIEEDAAKIFVVQILRGLKYLHDNDICHRDIKCDNTLLDESMNIKLVDFGAAKVLNRQSLAATRRTRMGEDNGVSLTGTPMYMAPEVIQGGSTTNSGDLPSASRPGKLGAQDIWSLGCCIVEMITGKPPWAHLDNEWAIMYQVVQGNPRLPDAADISSDGMQFIKRCFARHPADRPRAEELLKDRWVASTVRNMERLEARGQTSGRLATLGNPEFLVHLDFSSYNRATGDDDSEVGDSAATRSTDRYEQQRQHRHKHSISSVGSMGSASGGSNLASRSRATSINRKHVPGDLRFITSATGGPSGEAMLSMMEREKAASAGAIGIMASSTSDRSPGNQTGVGGLLSANILQGNAACQPLSSPVGNTPGSPSSATSMHAAWPFNKDTTVSSTRSSRTHAAFSSNIGADAGGAVKMALATPEILGSAGEGLVAKYSSPSLIYQVLNSNAAAGSLARSTSGAGSVSTPLGPLSSSLPSGLHRHSVGVMESPIEPTSGSVSQFDVVWKGHGQRSSSFEPVGTSESSKLFGASGGEQPPGSTEHLSNDEIQDLSETTRMAVAAMLSMPLEGADVAGVSGWLGEGFTPMEMLGVDEVNETLAATSHIVVREREQQLRRQQEIRHLLHRQQFLNTLRRQTDGSDTMVAVSSPSAASDSRLALNSGNLQSILTSEGPQSDSGVTMTNRFSGIEDGGAQRSEPPALYPLPSDEETN